MNRKMDKNSLSLPDSLFQVKEMSKRIKFILKLENLYPNRDDSNGYYCNKVCESTPYFSIRLNDKNKYQHIQNLLTTKYNYCTDLIEPGHELIISTKPILDPSDVEIDNQIKDEIKSNFETFDVESDDDPKLKILRSRYKRIIGAIRYHFPMSYGFNENSSNGYRSTRIKNSRDTSFLMQFTATELADNISHFLFNNGYKVTRINENTLNIFLDEVTDESDIIKNMVSEEFTSEQLGKIWDMLNTNGLVLLDVNNQFPILDMFNGKGLPQINKEQFIKIIENQ